MKKIQKIYSSLILIFLSNSVFSQTIHPQIGNLKGISYQAVAIDETGKEIVGMDVSGKPLYEKTIAVRFSILKGNNGIVQFQETHTALTDRYGLFSLVIGTGSQTGSGAFSKLMDIPWIDANQFLKVELSTKNDGNYKLVSLQQFMSVPYSFYASDIADDAITTWKILDSTIVNKDIATSAVNSRTILDGSILSQDIATGAVTTTQILDGTILNQDIANGTIDLTTKVAGILPVPNGGTGVASSTGILIGGGTGPISSLGVATNGQIPIGNGTAAPVLSTLTAGTGISITNSAGAITINSTITGISSQSAGGITVGVLPGNGTFISPPLSVPGVVLGTIIVGSYSQDLLGCMLTAYVEAPGQIRVAIFNSSGASQNLGTGTIKVLVVQ